MRSKGDHAFAATFEHEVKHIAASKLVSPNQLIMLYLKLIVRVVLGQYRNLTLRK